MDPMDNTTQSHAAEPITPQLVMASAPPPRNRLLGCLGWLGLCICLMVIVFQSVLIFTGSMSLGGYDLGEGIEEQYLSHENLSHAKWGFEKVAIISVDGVIMEGDGFVKRQIDRVKKDKAVQAVVLRVDSPGGTVTGSDYIHHHLVDLSKQRDIPIVCSMGSMAASGGYYVAMAVGDRKNTIFAEPTTTTGSIGVIIPHYDITAMLEEWGVVNDSIASHPRKQMLSMTRKLSPEDREILERYVGDSFDRFKDIVRSGRPALKENDAKLTELATGEIFTANQAKRHGLVDEIGFIEDAIDRAIEIAQLNKDNVRVVRYRKPKSLFQLASSRHDHELNLRTILELSTPRAYYLTTTLPTLLSTAGR